MRPIVIAFEGLPGAGKTTAIEHIVPVLASQGLRTKVVDIELTGNSPELRAIARTYPPGHPSRIMLFWVLRLQQYQAIQEDFEQQAVDVIIADRYWGSTVAFDLHGNNVPQAVMDWVGSHIHFQPDLTFFFDVPLELIHQRKEAKTMLDPLFAKRTEFGYKLLAERSNWTHVDASQTIADVVGFCLNAIQEQLDGP